MKIYSLKKKKYIIFREFCENIFQDIDINLLIIDTKLDNYYFPPINIRDLNSLIVIPYLSDGSIILDRLKLIDINPKVGEFIGSVNNLKHDIITYKILKIDDYISIIDYVNIHTGRIEGSIISYRIHSGVLTIITTIELFLLSQIELDKRYKAIFTQIKNKYKELLDLNKKSKEINDKLKIEYLLNGNPLPILISQFEDNQINKKSLWSKWEKLDSLTNLFSKEILISTINKLKNFAFLKEQDDFYIFKPYILELSKKYQKFGSKFLES